MDNFMVVVLYLGVDIVEVSTDGCGLQHFIKTHSYSSGHAYILNPFLIPDMCGEHLWYWLSSVE